jgi:two-component system, OmpR family, phosphate regulon sensor histidine kinase PhoR
MLIKVNADGGIRRTCYLWSDMKPGKYTLAIVLMVISMLLLVTLQFFWILSSYEKVYEGLRRDTNLIFRTSAMSIRSATWMRKIEQLSVDSTTQSFRVLYYDSIKSSQPTERGIHKNVEVVVRRESDNIGAIRRRMSFPQIDSSNRSDPARFILDLRNDTLDIDTLRRVFGEALSEAQITVAYNFVHRIDADRPEQDFIARRPPRENLILDHHENFLMTRSNDDESIYKILGEDTIRSMPFHTSPFHEYTVLLYNVRGLLVSQIAPQIFFSLVLTLMVGSAFLLMFKNLRSQQRLMQAKNEFIGNISHELKTPVATVSVVLEALRNFHAIDNPALTQEYLGIAQSELNRLAIMTDRILKTAVFEDKGVEYEPETVDMNEIVSQVMRSMKLVYEKNKAQVHYKTEGTNFNVSGSPVHLTNVIYNLLDNALKYCILAPRISVTLIASAEVLHIRVKDNGVGIDRAYHKKIFEKFFRVPTGDIHNTKGYGLGLNYVSTVVSRHGGMIVVESEPANGSEFIVSLPIVVVK